MSLMEELLTDMEDAVREARRVRIEISRRYFRRKEESKEYFKIPPDALVSRGGDSKVLVRLLGVRRQIAQ